MKTINTEIVINAPAEKIWSTLMDFTSYSTWNPFIISISGKAQVNQKLNVFIQPPQKKAMQFCPRVISLIPNQEFVWLGHLFFPGVFDGEHHFKLETISDTQVRFKQSENFSGLFHKPIMSMIEQSTLAGFEAMNNALKKRSETTL